VERGQHGQDRLAQLAGDDATVGEAAAIEIALDAEIDLVVLVAAAQEIGVKRMDRAILRHGAFGRRECLSNDLSAEDSADAAGLAAARKRSPPRSSTSSRRSGPLTSSSPESWGQGMRRSSRSHARACRLRQRKPFALA
jgi:hypothetical protein